MRYHARIIAAAALVGAIAVSAGAQQSRVDLLIVPARYTTLQIAFDILARRDIVLVSYQAMVDRDRPVLHVWDGVEWIPISYESYARFDFIRTSPKRIVLVGDDETLPRAVIDAAVDSSAGQVVHVASLDVAAVLNALAKAYNFRSTEWEWFASRYQLELSDANQAARGRSWYDEATLDRSTAPWHRQRRQRRAAPSPEEAAAAPESSDPAQASDEAPAAPSEVPPDQPDDQLAASDAPTEEEPFPDSGPEDDAVAPPMEPPPLMGPDAVLDQPIK